jgi:hypothetical protein
MTYLPMSGLVCKIHVIVKYMLSQYTYHCKIHVITKYISLQNNIIAKYGQCNLKNIGKLFFMFSFFFFFPSYFHFISLFLVRYPNEWLSLSWRLRAMAAAWLWCRGGVGEAAAVVRLQRRAGAGGGRGTNCGAGQRWSRHGSGAKGCSSCGAAPARDSGDNRWGTFILHVRRKRWQKWKSKVRIN